MKTFNAYNLPSLSPTQINALANAYLSAAFLFTDTQAFSLNHRTASALIKKGVVIAVNGGYAFSPAGLRGESMKYHAGGVAALDAAYKTRPCTDAITALRTEAQLGLDSGKRSYSEQGELRCALAMLDNAESPHVSALKQQLALRHAQRHIDNVYLPLDAETAHTALKDARQRYGRLAMRDVTIMFRNASEHEDSGDKRKARTLYNATFRAIGACIRIAEQAA